MLRTLPKEREKRPKIFTLSPTFRVLTTSFVIVLVLTTFHYPKLINHQKQQDFETAKLTDFGLARILPQYANDRRDVNPKTTPKIGPPKYRAPEVEKHDSEKDHTYAFSSDVYGYGVMCFQLIDQVKKRRRKSHPHEVDFVTGLGNACCEEDPRARPTAAMCLAKCREFLGESWTANDRVWGNPNPTERVGYWTTEMMDVGTFKKVAPKEEEERQDSPSGLEHGETPTTTNGRTQTHGKRGKHSDDEDEDEDDDDDVYFDKSTHVSEKEMESALNIKAIGNKKFAAKNFKEALKMYESGLAKLEHVSPKCTASDAVELVHVLFLNCAAVHIEMKHYREAVSCASKSLAYWPRVKAYYRRGTALLRMARYEHAIKDFKSALKLRPNDSTVKKSLKEAQEKLKA